MGEVESQTYLAGQLKRHIVLVIENSASIYTQAKKTVNTENISGMFTVF